MSCQRSIGSSTTSPVLAKVFSKSSMMPVQAMYSSSTYLLGGKNSSRNERLIAVAARLENRSGFFVLVLRTVSHFRRFRSRRGSRFGCGSSGFVSSIWRGRYSRDEGKGDECNAHFGRACVSLMDPRCRKCGKGAVKASIERTGSKRLSTPTRSRNEELISY